MPDLTPMRTPVAHEPDSAEAAARIDGLPCGERMKQALRLVAAGSPYREAAKELGYADHRDVYRWAKRAGLLDVHSKRLVSSYRRLAGLANAELERRLTEAPEEISSRDLTILSGVSADKAARYENWGHGAEGDNSVGDRLGQALHRLTKGAGSVTLRIEAKRPGDDAIDVTPTRAAQSTDAEQN